jgi:hypothetical protein
VLDLALSLGWNGADGPEGDHSDGVAQHLAKAAHTNSFSAVG